MDNIDKKALYRLRAFPHSMRTACAARQRRLDELTWQAIEVEAAQWLEDVEGIAVRPMLAKEVAKMARGDWRKALHGFACAFGYAADQRRRTALARELYRRLSNAFDRLWLRTTLLAPRSTVQEAFA